MCTSHKGKKKLARGRLRLKEGKGAMKQRIQSSHIPLCHRHVVIATTLSVPNIALSSPHKVAMECMRGQGGLGWVGLAASCGSRPSGVGFLPCPTTRLNYLTVRFQGRADYRQPLDPTEAQVGGRYRRPVCRRARGQGCGRGLGLACGGQVWPGAPGPVGQAMGA